MTDTPPMPTFDLYILALRRFARIQRETAARYLATHEGVEYARCLSRAEAADAKANRLTDAVSS